MCVCDTHVCVCVWVCVWVPLAHMPHTTLWLSHTCHTRLSGSRTHTVALAHKMRHSHTSRGSRTRTVSLTHILWLSHTYCGSHTHFTAFAHILWLSHTRWGTHTHFVAHAHILCLSHTSYGSRTQAARTHRGYFSSSRLLTIIGLFCKRALEKRLYSAKETYDLEKYRVALAHTWAFRTHVLALAHVSHTQLCNMHLAAGISGPVGGGGGALWAGPMSVELKVHAVPSANALFSHQVHTRCE